ncbi:MAG: hypothetical protein K2J67_09125 [Lachnospiraceae bacterium]|nr:hypothetical protein [Lachnospiraceae bacterium]
MEFLFELLFEIIIEGTLDIGTSKKIPLIFRVLALVVFLGVYIGITGLLLIYGVDALRTNDLFGGSLCVLTAIIVVFGCIYMTVKKLRKSQVVE